MKREYDAHKALRAQSLVLDYSTTEFNITLSWWQRVIKFLRNP